ncbi:hypothetical protein SeMB42_g05356 [Synchytrium endobioticum]|uniref:Uncharacterized protein n=1 Tax=Synchytrium endobioticum TaxID=286115 RepID=A0A507CRV3_9FUNG|nr:hypothetical protein SeMB42_g05356 [Synchytrium endobioticum]
MRFSMLAESCACVLLAASVCVNASAPGYVYSPYDTVWLAALQAAIALAMFAALGIQRVQRYHALLGMGYLGATVVLGIIVSILFLLGWNQRELKCCSGSAFVLCTVPSYRDSVAGGPSEWIQCVPITNGLIRSGILWITQILTIHPTVSHILFLWQRENKAQKPPPPDTPTVTAIKSAAGELHMY